MAAADVVITSRSFGKFSPRAEQVLVEAGLRPRYVRGPLGFDELVDALQGARGAIVGTDVVSEAVLAAAPDLEVVVKHGAGVDNIDIEAARRLGRKIGYAPGVNANAVAEMTVALALALLRQLPIAEKRARAGDWTPVIGRELAGQTFGIVGFGRIGRCVARRLAGFELTLLAYDPVPDKAEADNLGVQLVSLEELLMQADIVSLHVPLTQETRGLLDEAKMALMKRGAYLINVSRGGVVDEHALAKRLHDGQLAGAALDVFSEEPPAPAHPLLQSPRVVPTPHSAAHTREALARMSLRAAENMVALLEGRACMDQLA